MTSTDQHVFRWLCAIGFIALLYVPAAPAAGAAPFVTAIATRDAYTAISIVGYGPRDSYGVEVSRSSALTADGHFARPLNVSPALSLHADGTVTWYLQRKLAAGAYFAHAYDDFTASVVAFAAGVGRATWDGKPYLAWSRAVPFTVKR